MTDVENIEQLIKDIFNRKKTIKLRNNTNRCIAPLNIKPLNMFAYNFINRLRRLNEKFKNNPEAINDICEKIKNIGEATQSHWAGPYSELIALDFYTQFSDFIKISYINILPISEHKNSIPALNGQKEKIDIDICLTLRNISIYTDVKSFNSVHIQIFDQIFENVELFALKKTGKNILIGVDNLSSIDYIDVKNNLGCEIKKIEEMLKTAVLKNSRFESYKSVSGIEFNFKIEYSNILSTVKEYSPYAMAEAYKYKFLDYGNKLIDNEYSIITLVKNPWFNEETVDFGDFNNIFYRALSRRTFMELAKNNRQARNYSKEYKNRKIKVSDISKNIAGIIFIDDNSTKTLKKKDLYTAYFYLNPNYKNKNALTIRKLEKFFRNKYERQIKDFDDFKYDNY